MHILLFISVCAFLLINYAATSTEEKSSSAVRSQEIAIPDSLDGYTLTMTSKKLIYLWINKDTLTLDNRAIVNNGEIGNHYEQYKEAAGHFSRTSNSPFNATITFSKDQWIIGTSSGDYTCKKIGKNKLLITWTETTEFGTKPPYVALGHYLFLYFKTPDEGKIYSLDEDKGGGGASIGGNISFILKKSSEN